jgi:hypothetical protein
MGKVLAESTVLCLTLGAIVTQSSTCFAADTHVIVGTQQVTWTYNGQKSTPGTTLVVDDLKVGDIVETQIPSGAIPHGFITIKKSANVPPVESKDPVLACGENKTSKPNAVLQEINCGPASKFGVRFTGSMQLQVLDSFRDETDFWCVVHHAVMSGALKLKQ